MSKPLIIVESPAKAKTIGKFLNNKFSVKASMGHIRDLPKKELGVDVENNFKPKYINDSTKKQIIDDLKKHAKDAPSIYLASDYDREGEAIAWHLSSVLSKESKNKPVYRIVFNEITQNAIKAAVENPGKIDEDKVDAQQTRRILDRIVGYKISPLLWKTISSTSLSAGRVQSVALRLICERDEEIKKFVPEEYWTIESEFWKGDLPPFKAILHKFDGEKVKLENEEQSTKIINEIINNQAILSSLQKTERLIQPQAPYITSTLQQDAARILNFSGKKTMMLAQNLYEGMDIGGETVGLITYMRTDSVRIANEAVQQARELIKNEFGEKSLYKGVRTFKNKNEAQEAHEAIRPTYPWRTPESLQKYLNNDQFKLYQLIWQRFISTQMLPVKLNSAKIDISCGKAIFTASGSVIVDEGFYKVYPHVNIALGENIHPDYSEQDKLEMKKPNGKQRFTKAPSAYTEAQLIKELESLGIGRPSTYASITNTILVREYVKFIEKRFYPTDLGILVNRFLVHYFDSIFNVKFTAEMEDKLDQVEYGKQAWVDLLKEYYSSISHLIEKVDLKEARTLMVEETDIKCEKCNHPMIIKNGRNGQYLACSNYPACQNIKSFRKDNNNKIEIIEKQNTETDIKCEKCGSPMAIKHSKNGEFLGCSNYPKCKNIINFSRGKDGEIIVEKPKETGELCPTCGKPLVIRKGRYGEFYSCSAYPKCKFIRSMSAGVKCPKCHEGELVAKKGVKNRTFYACSKYPDCDYIAPNKPLAISCVECNNPYLEEHTNKETKIKFKKCPNCGKEYY
ncbi:MAG TPA: type I DNA topoisomerase [Candidatus Cloacimonadota bacterium]|nr:type I DNA topoisomerase [Candidatus Cloacimonadota bacterium]